MAAITMRQDGVFGAPLMKFTLTYDGPLPASANKAKNGEKWRIRKEMHPQLVDLWATHPALRHIERNRHFPRMSGSAVTQVHQIFPSGIAPSTAPEIYDAVTLTVGSIAGRPLLPHEPESIDLCVPINRHGALFRPLVRNSYALHCGLKVTFLRQEDPGKIYQQGDIDGRIKTLLDALAMPQHAEQVLEQGTDPIFCLLEDDALVSGLHVESERLLGAGKPFPPDYVRLNIEVDVRVRQATIYNQSFLG